MWSRLWNQYLLHCTCVAVLLLEDSAGSVDPSYAMAVAQAQHQKIVDAAG